MSPCVLSVKMMSPCDVLDNLYGALSARVHDTGAIHAEIDQFYHSGPEVRSFLRTAIREPLEYLHSHLVHLHNVHSLTSLAQHYITCLFKTAMYSRFYTRRGRVLALPTDEHIQTNMNNILTILRDVIEEHRFEEIMHKIIDVFYWVLNQERCHVCLPFIPVFRGWESPPSYEDFYNSYETQSEQATEAGINTQEGGESAFITPADQ